MWLLSQMLHVGSADDRATQRHPKESGVYGPQEPHPVKQTFYSTRGFPPPAKSDGRAHSPILLTTPDGYTCLLFSERLA